MTLPRDPKDETYLDLAGAASYLVTWKERHLTYLMRGDTPEGIEFRTRFPSLEILSPPSFFRRLQPESEGSA
jgi:predicted nucleic acid-binding protein